MKQKSLEITAESIKKTTRAAQAKADRVAKKKTEEERRQAAKNERWLKTTYLKDCTERAIKQITEAAVSGKFDTMFNVGDNETGKIVSPLLAEVLRKREFKVTEKAEYYNASGGSADDGYAYAHDAGFTYLLQITWRD